MVEKQFDFGKNGLGIMVELPSSELPSRVQRRTLYSKKTADELKELILWHRAIVEDLKDVLKKKSVG